MSSVAIPIRQPRDDRARALRRALYIALGANASSVLRLVIASAGGVIGIGIAAGLIAAAVLSRSISVFLFGVPPLDPITFALVPMVLIVTATIAVAAPAWRAARVDPVVAFRNE